MSEKRCKVRTFADRCEDAKAFVYDLRATLNGEKRYFIINVNPDRHTAFLNAVAIDQGMRLEDYGEILHRGWDEPDDDLKARLRQRFGMYQCKSGTRS